MIGLSVKMATTKEDHFPFFFIQVSPPIRFLHLHPISLNIFYSNLNLETSFVRFTQYF